MQGQCLCKAVTITTPDVHELHACHCDNCRTWSGGTCFSFATQDPDIQGAEHIRHYQSSEWGERGFCEKCGTHLYFHLLGTPQYFLMAGLFPKDGFALASQIFIDHQAPYTALAADTPKLTGAEFFAAFANGEE